MAINGSITACIEYDPSVETPEQAIARAKKASSEGRLYDDPFEWKALCALITLRDQFAMAALTGMLASGVDSPNFRRDQAEYCFAVADAMMEARRLK